MSQEYITFTIGQKKNIALIAHDNEKQKLIAWCKEHKTKLEKHNLYGTGNQRKDCRINQRSSGIGHCKKSNKILQPCKCRFSQIPDCHGKIEGRKSRNNEYNHIYQQSRCSHPDWINLSIHRFHL